MSSLSVNYSVAPEKGFDGLARSRRRRGIAIHGNLLLETIPSFPGALSRSGE